MFTPFRHFLSFDILSQSAILTFDIISIRRFVPFYVFSIRCFFHSMFLTIRPFVPVDVFFNRRFVPFGVLSSTFCPSTFFLLSAFFTSTFCRWTTTLLKKHFLFPQILTPATWWKLVVFFLQSIQYTAGNIYSRPTLVEFFRIYRWQVSS